MLARVVIIPGTSTGVNVEISEEEDRILRYGGTVSRNAISAHLLMRAKNQYLDHINTECDKALQAYISNLIQET